MDLHHYAFLLHLADARMKRLRPSAARRAARRADPNPDRLRVRTRVSGVLLRLADVIDPEPRQWPVQQA